MFKFYTCLLLCILSFSALSQTDEKLDQLLREIEKLQTELNSYRGQVDQVEQQLQEQELLLAQNHRQIFNTERAIVASEGLLGGLLDRLDQLKSQRYEQEQQLRQEITVLYRSGRQEPLKLILNQQNPAVFGRMLHYYQALAENRQAKIDEYLDTAEALKQTEISRAEELRYQEQLLVNLNGARSSLENQFAERERLLASLEGSIATTQEEIAANQANRERLETLVRNITTMTELSMLTDQRPFSEIQGQCKWPTQGRILASFGSLRTGNIRWDGMMIVSSMGNPVLSVHTGRVVFSDYLRGYGLLVIVDHDDGYLTLYGHNQTLFVEAGDWVQSEQMIARVGNSGGQRDAVLYFEIRKNGEPTNPANWCG
jgi:septal ring factor EnvC (AmiA/AmiB activator)